MLNLRKQNMKYWIAEMPIGDPFGGAAFGQKNDPIFALPTAAQVLIGGMASNILGGMMAPKQSAPQAPTLTSPTAMPGEAETKAAERASIAEQLRRRGRASTVLTDQTGSGTTDKLGA